MFQKRDKLFLGSLKNESQLKNIQKQIKSRNRSWRAKNYLFSQTKNVKQFYSEIPKLKTNYHRVNQKEINVKSNLKQTKLNFFSRKFEIKAIKISVLRC